MDVAALLAPKPVPFTAGGVPLYLKPFDVATKVAAAAIARRKDEPGALAELYRLFVSRSVCDSTGEAYITPEMVDAMDGTAADAIVERVMELNGLSGKAPAGQPAPS